MYTTNLPDAVMIPDIMVAHIERGILSEQAKRDARAWVAARAGAQRDIRDFWKRQMRENVVACRTYGLPECVIIFQYVYQLIEVTW